MSMADFIFNQSNLFCEFIKEKQEIVFLPCEVKEPTECY
jgi:hypothetical protein